MSKPFGLNQSRVRFIVYPIVYVVGGVILLNLFTCGAPIIALFV